VSSAIAASRRSPKAVSVELPVTDSHNRHTRCRRSLMLRFPITAKLSPTVVLSVGARERARESKDPGAVSSAIAASRRSPKAVSEELPVTAWSQPALSGFFDSTVAYAPAALRMTSSKTVLFFRNTRCRRSLMLRFLITAKPSPTVVLSVARVNARASRRIPVQCLRDCGIKAFSQGCFGRTPCNCIVTTDTLGIL
jgi:hypothetical protein